ncbi:MAG: hypothetical protein ACPGJV_03985 [Bacteriovoracaceae bacterium]
MKFLNSVKLLLVLFLSFLINNECFSEISDIYLSRGEIKPIDFPRNSKFSISDPSKISVTSRPSASEIIIKSKALGQSTLNIWNRGELIKTYRIAILNFKPSKELKRVIHYLKNHSLNFKQIGFNSLKILKPLEDKAHYLYLNKLLRTHKAKKASLSIQGELSSKIWRPIITEVYSQFYAQFEDSINCYTRNIQIFCEVDAEKKKLKTLLTKLESRYQVSVMAEAPGPSPKNYRVSLKIIQFENLDDKHRDLGLEEFKISLSSLFKKSFNEVYENNLIHLKDEKVNFQVIAEPEITTILDEYVELKIGGEIPFQGQAGENRTETKWKFAGLSVKLKLERFGSKLKAKSLISLSSPTSEGQFNSNTEKSMLYLYRDEPTKLFTVGIKSYAENHKSIPYLNKIPLLSALFSSRNKSHHYKKIYGIINVEELQ